MMQKKMKKPMRGYLKKFFGWVGVLWRHSWVLTVIFFIGILCGAVIIWWQNIYRPIPTQQVLDKFAKAQDDFNQMSQSIQRVINKINDRKDRFKTPPDYASFHNIFKKITTDITNTNETKKEEIPVESQVTPNESNKDGVLPVPQPAPNTSVAPGTTVTTTTTTTTPSATDEKDESSGKKEKK